MNEELIAAHCPDCGEQSIVEEDTRVTGDGLFECPFCGQLSPLLPEKPVQELTVQELVDQVMQLRAECIQLATMLDMQAEMADRMAERLLDPIMTAERRAEAAAYRDAACWIREDVLKEVEA